MRILNQRPKPVQIGEQIGSVADREGEVHPGSPLRGGGLRCEQVEVAYGAGTGLHRILVEFGAGVVERLFAPAYRPAKGCLAIVFYPLKWLDGWLAKRDSNRIAGGFIGIGTKPA